MLSVVYRENINNNKKLRQNSHIEQKESEINISRFPIAPIRLHIGTNTSNSLLQHIY